MNSGFNPLLDNSVPWTVEKIKLLDDLVKFFYENPSHPNIVQANQILTQLKENTPAWLATDAILKVAQDFRTKFFALQGLEGLILYRWKDLSDKERNIIRNFIVEMVVGMGRNIDNQEYQQIVRKANQILIQILKQEWETSSKDFILKICNMSRQDPNICENGFDILKILSEEILDSFKHQMKLQQIRSIRELYQNEFGTIYQLCIIVIQETLQNSQNFRLSLIKSCLDTLSAYLYWLPLNLIFKTDLIGLLLQTFELKDVQLLCVKILTEIVSLNEILTVDKMAFQEINQKIIELYSNFMERLNNYITPETNLLAQRTQLMKVKNPSVGFFNSFSKQIALFLSAFMKIHLFWIELFLNELNESDQGILINLIKKGFQYLVHLSELQGHTFRICVDFWNDFTSSLLKKNGTNNHIGQNFNIKEIVYHPVVLEVSGIMILKMTRPPEVTVVVDDHGKLIEDVPFDPEGNSLYDRMKELMSNLTIIDWKEIKYLIASKLEEQLNKSPWNFHNLNSLYWTIGSISQNIENSANQTFVFDILRRLFDLVHQCQEPEQRLLTAINFIYLVGQYSTFFKTDWVLLESITEKLIDFMSQASGGIEKMAAATFLKMAKTSKEQYLAAPINSTQYNSTEPYIGQLIFKISNIIPNLQVNQRLILYESIGNILAAELNLEKKQYLINLVLQEHWEIWEAILKEIEFNLDILKNEECIEKLYWIIKIHEVFASTICQDFFQSLTRIYLNMLKVYLLYSGILNKEIQMDPKVAPTHHLTKKMKNLRKEIIVLIKTYIQKCNDNDIIVADILPSLNDLFDDYFNDNIIIREHEILLILVTIIERFGGNVFQLTSNLMGNVFQALLSTPNIDTNPVLLINTIRLIAAITRHCFQEYLSYAKAYWSEGASAEAEQLEFFLKCVLLGLGFEINTQKQSLETLDLIMRNLPLNLNLVNLFCKEYYMIALQEVLTLLTNPNQKDAFHQQAEVLLLLIQLINGNYSSVSLVDNQGLLNNQEYIYQYLITFFSKGILNATRYVQELMNPDQSNTEQFKVILRNVLIESFQYDPMSKEEGEQD